MPKLKDSYNLTKGRRLQLNGSEKKFIEIPSIGDGNCGPYSFLSGIIDLIYRDQLKMSEEDFQKFFKLVFEKVNSAQSAYSDISLKNLKAGINANPIPTFEQFKGFIQNELKPNREDIAAVEMVLTPGLRKLARFLVQSSLTKDNADPERINSLKEIDADRVDMDLEALKALAQFFKVNLNAYIIQDGELKAVVEEYDPRLPTISIVNIGRHWNYLVPEEYENDPSWGFAWLPDISEVREDVIKKLRTTHAKKEKQILSMESLQKSAEEVSILTESLLDKNEKNLKKKNEIDPEILDGILAETNFIIDQARQVLDISKVKLSPLEEQLLKQKPDTDSTDADERLARALQNAEILDFFTRNYEVLSGQKVSPAKKVTPVHKAPDLVLNDKDTFIPAKK